MCSWPLSGPISGQRCDYVGTWRFRHDGCGHRRSLDAQVCEIYTDVDGVYTADPRMVSQARKLDTISSEEMLEMAATGAKVLTLRCVEFGRRYGVDIHVRSSFIDAPGTWITQGEEEPMEQAIVSGITYALEDAKVTVVNVPDKPGVAARVFTALAEANINVDMIIQNVSEDGATDISFTVGQDALDTVRTVLEALQAELKFDRIVTDDAMAKISLIGAGEDSSWGCRQDVRDLGRERHKY